MYMYVHAYTGTYTLPWGNKSLAFIWFSQSSMTQKWLIIPKLNGYTLIMRNLPLCESESHAFSPFYASDCAHPSAWNIFPSGPADESYPFFKAWHT